MGRLFRRQSASWSIGLFVWVTCGNSPAQGDILVGNYFSGRVFQYAENGSFVREFVDENEQVLSLSGMALHPDGSVLVASMSFGLPGRDVVFQYDATSSDLIREFVEVGSFTSIQDQTLLAEIAVGPNGDIYAGLLRTSSVRRYNGVSGAFIEEFTKGGPLDVPISLTFGPDGNLYVASLNTDAVLRYDGASGNYIDKFAFTGGLDDPSNLTFGPDGNLYVSSRNTDDVKRYDGLTGEFIDTFATGGGLNSPEDLKFGPNGHLYVVSFLTNEVKKYDGLTGKFLGNAIADSRLDFPLAIEFVPNIPEPSTATMTLLAFAANRILPTRRRHSLLRANVLS